MLFHLPKTRIACNSFTTIATPAPFTSTHRISFVHAIYFYLFTVTMRMYSFYTVSVVYTLTLSILWTISRVLCLADKIRQNNHQSPGPSPQFVTCIHPTVSSASQFHQNCYRRMGDKGEGAVKMVPFICITSTTTINKISFFFLAFHSLTHSVYVLQYKIFRKWSTNFIWLFRYNIVVVYCYFVRFPFASSSFCNFIVISTSPRNLTIYTPGTQTDPLLRHARRIRALVSMLLFTAFNIDFIIFFK